MCSFKYFEFIVVFRNQQYKKLLKITSLYIQFYFLFTTK